MDAVHWTKIVNVYVLLPHVVFANLITTEKHKKKVLNKIQYHRRVFATSAKEFCVDISPEHALLSRVSRTCLGDSYWKYDQYSQMGFAIEPLFCTLCCLRIML